jgi:two-component system NtrC family sensor kinase
MTMQNNVLKAQELNAQVQYRLIEELSASEHRYRELVERIQEVVFKCDADGKLLFLNAAWTTILGYSVKDSLLQPMAQFIVGEDRELVISMITKELHDGEAEENVEVRFKRSDGEPVWLMLAVQAGESEGKVGSLYCIDERKRAQQSLEEMNDKLEFRVQQRTAELAKINRQLGAEIEARKRVRENLLKAERLAVVGETSGRVAHEVLNPITSIFSRVEHNIAKWKEFSMLLQNSQEIIKDWQEEYQKANLTKYLQGTNEDGVPYGDEDFELLKKIFDSEDAFRQEREQDLKFIIRQLERVIKIINNIRGAVRQQRSIVELSIIDPIEEAYDVMADSLVKRGIKVVKNLPEDLPTVLADENELIQIFTNLYRNAMQSIDEKGQRGGFIETAAYVSEGHIEILIKDNGNGIPKANQGAIFNFDFSTKCRGEGTGMGLGISRRFIRENGGDMVLQESREGEGTTFLITIPFVQP